MRLIYLMSLLIVLSTISCSGQKKQNSNKDCEALNDKLNEYFLSNEESGLPQDEANKVLNFSNGKNIYVRAKIWGISSNHEEIIFSETPITIADKEKDYVFYTDEVFYKIAGDTLNIYACDCYTSEPKSTFKGVRIILNDLKTSSQIKDYSKNYKRYGLERMSIHE